MELVEGKIYLCADNEVRRLDKIEKNFLHYSMSINFSDNKFTWLKLSKTKRSQVEKDFTNGVIINENKKTALFRARNF